MVASLVPHLRDTSQSLEFALRRAKFRVPAPPHRLLYRRHLVARLRSLTAPEATSAVVVVSAPIGSGKTTLLGTVTRERASGTSAWCTLDRDDNDPHEFGVSILEAILKTQSPDDVGRAARARPPASDALDEALLIANCGEPLMLVLDESEHIRADATHATIRRLISQAPSSLSVVLLTNRDVELPTRGSRIEVLRGADLAFSVDEMRELLALERLPVSDDDAEILTRWTEGVASTATLAAAAYRDARDREQLIAMALRADSSAHVVLCERVLERMSSEHRMVLLSSSVVDPVSGDLAATLSGMSNGASVLNELVRADVFFDAIPGCADWYRHRHPSRELLSAELEHSFGERVKLLHATAARWFNERGHPARALDSAIRGNDWNLVCELVRVRWIATNLDELDSGLDEVPPIPAELVHADIDAALLATAIDIERAQHDRAKSRLDLLSRSELAANRLPESQLFEMLLCLRLARDASDALAIRQAGNALLDWCHSASQPATLLDDVTSVARRALAEASLIDGDLDAAIHLFERECNEALINGHARQAADATAALAVATALSGRVRRAMALVEELGDTWFSGTGFSHGVRSTARAICEYHADNLPAAQVAVSEARDGLRPCVYRNPILTMVAARIAASIGDHAGASRLSRQAMSHGHGALLAVVCDALGMPVGHESAASAPGRATGTMHPYSLGRASLLTAVRSHETERCEDAWWSLERTLALVDRNDYGRMLVDSEWPVRPLLRDYIAQARPYSQTAWQLLRRLPADRGMEAAIVIETLTDRELAVLRHLPTMKSNREIAAEMYFSVNTVKTHLKSIYRKLGVHRRRAAVDEASARSLL